MHFRDHDGRTIFLRGINLSDGKFPRGCPTYLLESLDADVDCSYIGMPLPLDDAPTHLKKLRYVGFNALRVAVTWEALEHGGPGVYDDEYIEYMRRLVEVCVQHGFRVIINPHQDLWSRFAGGSGAPLWTLHACGLDPAQFGDTHAAIRYAEWPMDKGPDEKDPKAMPPMMWTTNHNRLATSTLFALFFAGRDFAPKCVIDGLNIQDYLQQHYLAAYARLAARLGELPFAYDSMNEPESGYVGLTDLSKIEREGTAKIGSTPAPIESMRLGMGMEQTVDDFHLASTGPRKVGTVNIKPRGSCWLKREDPRWGWTRSSSWPLNMCVWALHDVWNTETGELNKPGYFGQLPSQSPAAARSENESEGSLSFISSYWQEFHSRWGAMLRQHSQGTYIFLQPSVFTPPPAQRREEPLMAYSPHYYDGLTIMKGHWHEHWNVDVVGLLRGKYWTKMQGLRVGRGSVRKVLSDQLGQLGRDIAMPTLVGEMGIPFPLDNGKAYRDGDYTDHVKALDALISGCDDHLLNYTLWTYSALNTHEWGDGWNGEDLSIHCSETGSFPNHDILRGFRAPAAWCRPYVVSLTGDPLSMNFDVNSGQFKLELESSAESGFAVVYLPWLHYRNNDGEDRLSYYFKTSLGQAHIDADDDQYLRWEYGAGCGTLEIKSTPVCRPSPERLGTVVK